MTDLLSRYYPRVLEWPQQWWPHWCENVNNKSFDLDIKKSVKQKMKETISFNEHNGYITRTTIKATKATTLMYSRVVSDKKCKKCKHFSTGNGNGHAYKITRKRIHVIYSGRQKKRNLRKLFILTATLTYMLTHMTLP